MLKARKFLAPLSLFFLFVVSLGAYTRLKDAGLGCPDWPGCYGAWIVSSIDNVYVQDPLFNAKAAWIEMIHRYAAGVAGLLLIIYSLGAVIQKRYRIVHLSLIALIIFQALLGKWTVTMKLQPVIVSLHFLGGASLVLILWKLHLLESFPLKKNPPPLPVIIKCLFGVYFLQIALGAWVSTNYAALACLHHPLCLLEGSQAWADAFERSFSFAAIYRSFDPLSYMSSEAKQFIQLIHRVNGIVLLLIFLRTISFIKGKSFEVKAAWWSAAVSLIVQISLGLILIWYGFPLMVATAHNTFSLIFGLCLLTFIHHLRRN